MKTLMLGNEAAARGIYEAGCSVVSSYPGTPSTEITEELAKYSEIYTEWAPNEKVAMEVAFGASLAGKRSFCGMKHVGVNVAADPMFTMSYTGVNAGLVIGVADDPGMHSSQNEQDSRHYAKAAKLPMLEPSDSKEARDFAKAAFEISEKFDTPVMLRMFMRVAHSRDGVELGERVEVPAVPYEKKPYKYVMMPGYAIKRHPLVEERTVAIADFAASSAFNRVEMGSRKLGIITSGTAYQYAKEALGDNASYLKLGIVHPISPKQVLDFAASVERLVVIEELDPFIEEFCNSIGLKVEGKSLFPMCGELSSQMIAAAFGYDVPAATPAVCDAPARPPVLCAGCPHRGIFYTLLRNKLTVLGDIGCYTLGAVAPLNSLDSTLCMGASISGIHGFNKADENAWSKTVAVIGDSTFMHSGVTGLINIAYNNSPSTVIVLDNSTTGMTGHQNNPLNGRTITGDPAQSVDLEALCRAIGINRIRVVDPYDLKTCNEVIKEELNVKEPSVIISRRPCALLKTVKHPGPISIDPDKCRGCKSCMRIGCPAISFRDGRAVIDATLCVGCKVCTQLCAFDAFNV